MKIRRGPRTKLPWKGMKVSGAQKPTRSDNITHNNQTLDVEPIPPSDDTCTSVFVLLLYYPPTSMSNLKLRLEMNPLSFLPFRNFFFHLLLVQSFFVELSCSLRLVLSSNVLQSCEIVTDYIFLPLQRRTKMFAQRNQRGAHNSICDDLMVVDLE